MALDVASHFKRIEDIVASCTIENPENVCDLEVEDVVEVVNDMSKQLKEMEVMVSRLHADSKAARDKLSCLEKERVTSKKELIKLKEEHDSACKKLKKLKANIQECTAKITQAKRKSVTAKDYELLNKNEKELSTYSVLTGIRWNFNVPENVKEGIITNSQNNFVKVIKIEKNLPKKKAGNMLWNIISESAKEPWINCDKGSQ